MTNALTLAFLLNFVTLVPTVDQPRSDIWFMESDLEATANADNPSDRRKFCRIGVQVDIASSDDALPARGYLSITGQGNVLGPSRLLMRDTDPDRYFALFPDGHEGKIVPPQLEFSIGLSSFFDVDPLASTQEAPIRIESLSFGIDDTPKRSFDLINRQQQQWKPDLTYSNIDLDQLLDALGGGGSFQADFRGARGPTTIEGTASGGLVGSRLATNDFQACMTELISGKPDCGPMPVISGLRTKPNLNGTSPETTLSAVRSLTRDYLSACSEARDLVRGWNNRPRACWDATDGKFEVCEFLFLMNDSCRADTPIFQAYLEDFREWSRCEGG